MMFLLVEKFFCTGISLVECARSVHFILLQCWIRKNRVTNIRTALCLKIVETFSENLDWCIKKRFPLSYSSRFQSSCYNRLQIYLRNVIVPSLLRCIFFFRSIGFQLQCKYYRWKKYILDNRFLLQSVFLLKLEFLSNITDTFTVSFSILIDNARSIVAAIWPEALFLLKSFFLMYSTTCSRLN